MLKVYLDELDGTMSVRTGDYADQENFLANFDGEWGWPGPLAEPEEASDAEPPENEKLCNSPGSGASPKPETL